MTTSPYFIPSYASLGRPRKSECEVTGEHQGDARTKDDAAGRWTLWTCCGEREFVGELFDCDTCGDPGLAGPGGTLPTGWLRDTNGDHCRKCQAPS